MNQQLRAEWGRRVRRLRRERELHVTQVADAAGITRQYLHDIEAGKYEPSDQVRLKIAAAIGVDPNELWAYPTEVAS